MFRCLDIMLPKVEKLMTPKALSDQTAHICTHMCLSVSQRNVDQKSLETVFKIAICRQYDDKWQNLETNGNQSLFFYLCFVDGINVFDFHP